MPRLLPWPMISSGCSLASAARTTSSTSRASRTFRVSTSASKSRQFRKRQSAAMDMDPAKLGAAVQGRKHLSRVEQPLRVERAFQALLLVEIDLAEHLAHQ